MTRLCFIDTETQGLHPARRAWEVALIVRDPFAGEYSVQGEHHWFICGHCPEGVSFADWVRGPDAAIRVTPGRPGGAS